MLILGCRGREWEAGLAQRKHTELSRKETTDCTRMYMEATDCPLREEEAELPPMRAMKLNPREGMVAILMVMRGGEVLCRGRERGMRGQVVLQGLRDSKQPRRHVRMLRKQALERWRLLGGRR